MVGDVGLSHFTISGMGTKMQCETYSPGYYFTKDLNEETQNGWSLFYEDTVLNGQLYNGFTPKRANGYLDYDTEKLRQTMLKHEAIFKKQVHELHRVYRIQRHLMDELKQEEQCSYPLQVQMSESSPISANVLSNASTIISQSACSLAVNVSGHSLQVQALQSSPYSTQLPSKCTSNMSQSLYSLAAKDSCSRPLDYGADDRGNPLEFSKSSGKHSTSVSAENHCASRSRQARDMIDLQLPPDAYIDEKDGPKTEEQNTTMPLFGASNSSNINTDFQPANDAKLTLSTGENANYKEIQNEDIKSQCLKSCTLVDLNEPASEVCYEDVAILCSSKIQDVTVKHEKIQRHQPSLRLLSVSQNLQKGFSKDKDRDEATSSHLHELEKEENRQEWQFFANEGQTTGSLNSFQPSSWGNKMPELFEREKSKLEKYQELSTLLSCPIDRESWLKGKPICYNKTSESLPQFYSKNCVGVASLPTSASMASSVSSWRSPLNGLTHLPAATQAFPYFSMPSTLDMQSRSSSASFHSSSNTLDKHKYNGDSTPHQSFRNEASPNLNGFLRDFRCGSNGPSNSQLQAISLDKPKVCRSDHSVYGRFEDHGTSVKNAKDTKFNIGPPNGFSYRFAPSESTFHNESKGWNGASPGGISWLKSKPYYHEPARKFNNESAKFAIDPTQVYPHLMSAYDVEHKEFKKRKTTKNLMQARVDKNEVASSSCAKKILGFTILDKSQQCYMGTDCSTDQDFSAINGFKRTSDNTSCKVKLSSMEKRIANEAVSRSGARDSTIDFREQIDLNSVAEVMDQTKLIVALLPSTQSSQNIARKSNLGIDLEAAVISEAVDPLVPEADILGSNQFRHVQTPESREKDQKEIEELDEATIRMTAETIVALSSDICRCSDAVTSQPSDINLVDNTLHWFADVIISNISDPDNAMGMTKGEGDTNRSLDLDDGLDFFESMTLKLTETKSEYCIQPFRRDNEKPEEMGIASMLLTKTRKCQGKKRRQKRDFQKDILPGLSSLSRHEVTEDLQTFGGLMQASGQSWQAGALRRNGCRNGGSLQARRGRQWRPRGASTTVIEIQADSPTGQNNTELEIDVGNVMAWGRTRRCRRQRCPSGHIAALS